CNSQSTAVRRRLPGKKTPSQEKKAQERQYQQRKNHCNDKCRNNNSNNNAAHNNLKGETKRVLPMAIAQHQQPQSGLRTTIRLPTLRQALYSGHSKFFTNTIAMGIALSPFLNSIRYCARQDWTSTRYLCI